MNQKIQDILSKVLSGDEATFTTKSGDEVKVYLDLSKGIEVKVINRTFFDPEDEMSELIHKLASWLM